LVWHGAFVCGVKLLGLEVPKLECWQCRQYRRSRDLPFGGISVLICRDFHQFPPVATSPTEALYHPTNTVKDSANSQIGRTLYEEFKTVAILKEQLRVTDDIWKEFLGRLRCGRVLKEDIIMLHGLVLGSGPTQKQISKRSHGATPTW
jgi:hypothetical protein